MDHFCYLFFVFVCHYVMSAPYSLVVTCKERADLLALSYVAFSRGFITFTHCVLGQVWYLTVSSPDLFLLSYF